MYSESLMATDAGDSKPVASANQFKVGMAFGLLVGSGLMLVFITGTSTSSPSEVNLAALPSVSGFPSGGAVKPGLINSLKSMRGSGPLQNAILANNLQSIRQDIKVRHGDGGWDEMPADVVAKEAKKYVGDLTAEDVKSSIASLKAEDWNASGPVKEEGKVDAGDIFKILGGVFVLTPIIIFAASHSG